MSQMVSNQVEVTLMFQRKGGKYSLVAHLDCPKIKFRISSNIYCSKTSRKILFHRKNDTFSLKTAQFTFLLYSVKALLLNLLSKKIF